MGGSALQRALIVICFLLLVANGAVQGEMEHKTVAPKNPAFDALKGLEGTWTGKAGPAGGASMEATVVYKVTGAGSALEERLFPGTAEEMVSMYHLDGNNVVMTHYCAAGNQPRMKLDTSDGKNFHFKFAGGTNIRNDVEHMHDVKIVLVDAGHLRTEWTAWKDGKPQPAMVFDLTRKQ